LEIRLQQDFGYRQPYRGLRRYTADADRFGCFTIVGPRNAKHRFDVSDASERVVLSCVTWTESWWAAFLGRKQYRITCDGEVIATLQFSALGLRRRAILATGEGPFPRLRRRFSLLGMEWSFDGTVLSISNVDESLAMAVVGLASCWLIRFDSDQKMGGNDV